MVLCAVSNCIIICYNKWKLVRGFPKMTTPFDEAPTNIYNNAWLLCSYMLMETHRMITTCSNTNSIFYEIPSWAFDLVPAWFAYAGQTLYSMHCARFKCLGHLVNLQGYKVRITVLLNQITEFTHVVTILELKCGTALLLIFLNVQWLDVLNFDFSVSLKYYW